MGIRNLDREDLDKKRLILEIIVIAVFVVLFVGGFFLSVKQLGIWTKVSAPEYVSDIKADTLIPGNVVRIRYDSVFTANLTTHPEGSGVLKYVVLKLSGKNEYIWAVHPDSVQGYMYWDDKDYYESPFASVGFEPAEPHSLIGFVRNDPDTLSDLKEQLAVKGKTSPSVPEAIQTADYVSGPNTISDTCVAYFIEVADKSREGRLLLMYLGAMIIGGIGTIIARRWAIHEQAELRRVRRFEQNSAAADAAWKQYQDNLHRIVRKYSIS